MEVRSRQHWAIAGKQYRVMTVTQAGSPDVPTIEMANAMDWDTRAPVKLLREATTPGQKPKPIAPLDPALATKTWNATTGKATVVFYRVDVPRYYALPLDTFVEKFTFALAAA